MARFLWLFWRHIKPQNMLKNDLYLSILLLAFTTNAQKVAFTEYDLSNGLHVVPTRINPHRL